MGSAQELLTVSNSGVVGCRRLHFSLVYRTGFYITIRLGSSEFGSPLHFDFHHHIRKQQAFHRVVLETQSTTSLSTLNPSTIIVSNKNNLVTLRASNLGSFNVGPNDSKITFFINPSEDSSLIVI